MKLLDKLSVGSKNWLNTIISGIFLVIIAFFINYELNKVESNYNETNGVNKIAITLKTAAESGLQSIAALRGTILNASDSQAQKNLLIAINKFDTNMAKLRATQTVSPGFKKYELDAYYKNLKAQYDIITSKINNGEKLTSQDNKNVTKYWRPFKVQIYKWRDGTVKKIKKLDENFQNILSETILYILELIVFNLIVLILVAFVITKSIVGNLNTFQSGLLVFFDFLNKKRADADHIQLNTNDEFGAMSKIVNENITQIKDVIQQDNKLIDDAQVVIGRVKHGWYSQHIERSTSNQLLEQFKNDVNSMIRATKEHFINMNTILEKYAQFDYRDKLVLEGIEKGGVFEVLVNDINKLRDSINEMLLENKSNGLALDNSSNILKDNVDTLSNNANTAAASLEETAAALEEITSNIANNSENVAKMTQYANALNSSSKDGQKLANETTSAMDEINSEVTAISEAISVIDQIAFQTNILSLNAAVEAATAGEAGKGFAVVAAEVRNLATRSSDAANEIKKLVENATQKANNGKSIADSMIEGYGNLNDNIAQTLELISDVDGASQEQRRAIEQINDAVSLLDQQTQNNASIATQTQAVAMETDGIAKLVVSSADEKEFIGKESVTAKKIETNNNLANNVTTKPQATPSRPIQKVESSQNKAPITPLKTVKSNSSDDEWESF